MPINSIQITGGLLASRKTVLIQGLGDAQVRAKLNHSFF